MYLLRVELKTDRRETMLMLSQPQLMHGAIERSFSGERKRRLWRIDWLENRCYVLILSDETPDFTTLLKQYGDVAQHPVWDTRDLTPLLSGLMDGQTWQFRLKANPVHSVLPEGSQSGRGKVLAHVTPAQQKQWLLDRAPSLGFALSEEGFDIVHSQWYGFDKGGGHRVTLRTASFEGILRITDTQRFQQTILGGVGRAKAYGCGLLTVTRWRGDAHG